MRHDYYNKVVAVVALVIFGVVSGPGTTGDGYYESCVVTFEGNQIELTE